MNDPWETQPETLDAQVERYANAAKKLTIHPDLVRKYARILVAAQTVVSHREQDERQLRDEMALLAASEHGVFTDNPMEARKGYSAARIAQQRVHNSAAGCSKRLSSFEKLLEKNYNAIRQPVADEFPLPKIQAASRLIRDFASATSPTESLAELKMAKSELSHTVSGHTFVWWRRYITRYRAKWTDMHELARCWRLTDAKDISTFQRTVRKLKPVKDLQGRTRILGCPRWALP